MAEHLTTRARGGISRRDFVRRSAIVGGNLLWIAPAIQTLAPAAHAHQISPATHVCCECVAPGSGTPTRCTNDSTPGNTVTDQASCEAFCTPDGLVAVFHTSPNAFTACGPGQKECANGVDHP